MTGGPRVLFVHPNAEVGGSDIALARTVAALTPVGVEAHVALPGEGPLGPALREAGARLHPSPMRQLRTLPSLAYQARYVAGLAPSVQHLARVIDAVRPDLVHTNSLYCLYGAAAARLRGTPHLWHVREIPPQIPALTAGYAGMVRLLSDVVLAMSDGCVEGLFGARAPQSCRVVPDALDAATFMEGADRGRLRRDLGVGPDRPLVGFAARLDPWKGAHVFIEAAALAAQQAPDALFLVSGGAPDGFEAYEADLRAQADRSGLSGRVLFLGWRYRLRDMADFMAGLDIFCHASTAPEPFGLVLLEAMAAGAPVIAADAGGPRTIVAREETGVLTPPGDAPSLARAIVALLGAPDRRAEMAARATRRLESHFGVDAFRQRMLEVYHTAMRRRDDAAVQTSKERTP